MWRLVARVWCPGSCRTPVATIGIMGTNPFLAGKKHASDGLRAARAGLGQSLP